MARRTGKSKVATVKRPQGVIPVAEAEGWAKAMDGLSLGADDDGRTVQELMQTLGLGKGAVLRHVYMLVKAGECTRGTSRRRGTDGVLRRIPVYQLHVKSRKKK